MSRLRSKAVDVKISGAAERRNWNPDPKSVHYKIYSWWLRSSGRYIENENFCHYWRVVAIWAPLRWIRKPALVMLGLAILALIVWLTVMFTSTVLSFVAVVIGWLAAVVYIQFSAKTGAHLVYEFKEQEHGELEWPWLSEKSDTAKALVVLATSPLLIVAGAFLLVVGSLVSVLIFAHEDHDIYRRFGRWLFGAQFSRNRWLSWVRPWLAAPLALLVLSWWFVWPRVLLAIAFCGVLVVGAMVLVAYSVDMRRERRAEQAELEKQRAIEARKRVMDSFLKELFAAHHPEWAGNEGRYAQWRQRYDRFCWEMFRAHAHDVGIDDHLRWAPENFRRSYMRRYRELYSHIGMLSSPVVKQRPQRVRRFFRGAGDLFSLLWSVILVKKWKICPRVELPSAR